MNAICHIVYAICYLVSLLPLRVLYVFADFVYLVGYRIMGYRHQLVERHLADSFPEKTASERLAIERRFFHCLCDYLVETIKMMSMSQSQMRRHLVFKGAETINQCVSEGQSCAVYLGHSFNWEWITSLPLWVTPEAHCGQLYHALESPIFDRLFLRLRQRWGAECIALVDILRKTVEYKRIGQPTVIGYLGDQVPFWNNIHYWCWFLNHDTPVMTGTERIARKNDQALFFLEIHKLRRGYYEAEFKLITREPKSLAEYEATDIYFRMLEESIRQQPEMWLWTHNRWKRTREEFNLRYDETTGHVDILSSIEELKEKKGL